VSFAASHSGIAVIGGGVVGLSIAWRLSQLGWQITLFDRQAVGQEASWVGAGMLAPGGEVSKPTDFARLLLEARSLYRDFVIELHEESGVPIDYQESGGLDLAYSDHELAGLLTHAATQARLGIASQPITPADVRSGWPQVRSAGLSGAIFYPTDAFVNARDLVSALKAACVRRGVHLREGDPVKRVTVDQTSVGIEASDPHLLDAAVIAAGAWSSDLPVLGVPPLTAVEPVKGHILGFQQPPQTCPSIVRYGDTYLLQRANGLVLAGASMEHVGFDRAIQPAVVAALAEKAGSVLPCLAGHPPEQIWIGFRPASEEIQIGPWHSSRLFVAYGHFRNGILLAPLTAARIAAAVGRH
jgi:glycine oxidase